MASDDDVTHHVGDGCPGGHRTEDALAEWQHEHRDELDAERERVEDVVDIERSGLVDLGWWTISGDELLRLLREAHGGADPDLLYAEAYANSDHEDYS